MDLRRTQTLVDRCNKYNHEIEGKAAQYIGKKLLRPIPQAAIDANDQLTLADQILVTNQSHYVDKKTYQDIR